MQARPFLLTARVLLLGGVAAAALSGCAAIPHLGPEPEIKPAAGYATSQSLAAPEAEWPQDQWWASYGDPQLNQLMQEALTGSPDLAEAQARVRQAEAVTEQTGSLLSPHLNAGATVVGAKQSYSQGALSPVIPRGWQDVGVVGLGLDWQLDFFGRNHALLAAATSETNARRADAAAARLALTTSIASTYAELAQLYAERDAARDALRVRMESEDLIGARVRQGLDTEAASERAHSTRASAEVELRALDEAIGLCRQRIAALLGQGPDRALSLDRPAPGTVRTFRLPLNLPAQLVGRRPDVVAARLEAEAARERIKAAKADFYPNVNLMALGGIESFGLDMLAHSGSTFGAAGPAISLPIFSAGGLEGAYRGARADYDAAVANYDRTLVHALQDVAGSAVSARALDDRLVKSREALAAAKSAYALTHQRYQRGLGTYLDVLSAEDALIATQRSVADLETRAFIIDVALIRALGGGYRT